MRYEKENKQILAGCSYRMKTSECSCERRTYKIFDYSRTDLNQEIVWTHKSCVCNEKIALSNRHQIDDGSKFVGEVGILGKVLERNFHHLLRKNTTSEVIEHYSCLQRRLYVRASEDLKINAFNFKIDSRIKMFLKDDKYHTLDVKAPRCIQFRNKRYGLLLAKYLQPIEKEVYSWVDESNTPVFAKGRNLSQRASDIIAKWELMSNPIAILADHSKFDAHVSLPLLKLEHDFYLRYFNNDWFLKKLLKSQLVNTGFTNNGTKFVTTGTRMSGDQNTGLGNSVINYAMLQSWLDTSRVKGYLYIDGDDSVIIVDQSDLHKLDMKYFEQWGMNTKFDYASIPEHIEFCQTRPVFDGVNWHCVRNPRRTLARMPWLTRRNNLMCLNRYMKSLGMCEVALSLGIPVTQALGEKLMQSGSGKYLQTELHYQAKQEYIKPWNVKPVPIRDITRESYYLAWDITPDEQRSLEAVTLVKPLTNIEYIFDQISEWPRFG